MSLLPLVGIDFSKTPRENGNGDVISSSLMFLVPAGFYAMDGQYAFASLLAASSVVSANCDGYDNICRLDNVFMFWIVAGVFWNHYNKGRPFDWIFWLKVIGAWSALKYSSLSKTKEEWQWRHCLWHIIAIIVLLSEV